MEMKLSKVNEFLTTWRQYNIVSEETPKDYYQEKSQGDEGERIEVRDLKYEGLFLKVTFTSDSYGDGDQPTSFEFVKPVQKNITDYEPVK